MNRFKSKAAWVSLISFVGLVLGNYGLYNKLGLTSESYQNIATALLGVLTAFGIFNNPENPNGF
jgi:uncharacterized membrane protein